MGIVPSRPITHLKNNISPSCFEREHHGEKDFYVCFN